MNQTTENTETVIVHVIVAVPLTVRLDENDLAVEVLGQAAPAFIESDLSINNNSGDAYIDRYEQVAPGNVSYGKWRHADEEEYDAATAILRRGDIE